MIWSRCLLLLVIIWVAAASSLQAASCKVVIYNLNNYSLQEESNLPAKSSTSLAAIEAILTKLHPDVLAVCEMGSRKDLSYLQNKLKKAGNDLPYTIWLDAPDPFRHLAFLSRFPIEQNNSRSLVSTYLPGQFIKRGILDVTLRLEEGFFLRLVGSHLKSRRPTMGNFNSRQIRLAEARALAAYIQEILKSLPRSQLLVFGDFNDRPTSSTLKTLSPALQDLAPSDIQGERWTHYFAKDDIYSRYDYLLASPALVPQIVEIGIDRSPQWNLASDHCPLYLVISTSSH